MSGVQPVIKWSGSKRHQAQAILAHIPAKFNDYYEPFLGGGSIMYTIAPKHGFAGDICKPLIDFWDTLKTCPGELIDSYTSDWAKLQEKGLDYYYEVRNRFNKYKNPADLLFLTRTAINGLIRFNKMGNFNSPFHHSRKGIHPYKLGEIITEWSQRIQGIEFKATDFRETLSTAKEGDLVYLDPPYFNTKGMFNQKLEFIDLLHCLEDLNKRNIKFILSYDGARGEEDMTVMIPPDLYKRHEYMYAGNSAFYRLVKKESCVIYESLYLNW